MTIPLVNPPTWGVGDELLSSQINQLDANTTYALDKRAAETDTLESVVSLTGAGRIVDNVSSGPDADTTFLVDAANRVVEVTTLTADRIYSLSATGAVTGDQLTFYCDPAVTRTVTIKDQAAVTLWLLGNRVTSYGNWVTFIYVGGWQLFRYSKKRLRRTYTADDTLVVPGNVFAMEITGVGGGASTGGMSAPRPAASAAAGAGRM